MYGWLQRWAEEHRIADRQFAASVFFAVWMTLHLGLPAGVAVLVIRWPPSGSDWLVAGGFVLGCAVILFVTFYVGDHFTRWRHRSDR